MSCVTGDTTGQASPCHKISVSFTVADEAFLFSTCGQQLYVSERIESEEAFAIGLRAAITEKLFTTA